MNKVFTDEEYSKALGVVREHRQEYSKWLDSTHAKLLMENWLMEHKWEFNSMITPEFTYYMLKGFAEYIK